MEVIQTLAGFFLATLGIPLGYLLFLYLPDEQRLVKKLFSWIKHPLLYVFVLSITVFFYPQPITAATLFVLFLPVGIVTKKKFWQTWLFSILFIGLFLLAHNLSH